MEHIFTDQNFAAEVLQSDAPVFVDFWAPWCGPCRLTGPAVDALAEEFQGKNIKIGKLNVDDNPETPGAYGVLSIPTFKIFKGGQPVDEVIGGVSKERLRDMIMKYI